LPKKIGRHLVLFDCINCDKCIPVCPNDANFVFALAPGEVPILKVRRAAAGWEVREDGKVPITETQQIGNFADFCNDCGNCDVFCPEDGGPYKIKPRFFGTLEAWIADRPRDGFFVARSEARLTVHARFAGRDYELEEDGGRLRYAGDGFRLHFVEGDPATTLSGDAAHEVDLTYSDLMLRVARALLGPAPPNYVSCLTR
jgi:putative selenate reductase